MIRALLILVLLATSARANDKVALLPLDAHAKLEIYGQPVASEIAQALIAGQLDVVVVLPKMAVPDDAKVIVDGKIAPGKGTAIELSIRVRDPRAGVVLQTFAATAPSLDALPKTTSELAQKVLPIIREQLAKKPPPVEPVKPLPPEVKPPPPPVVAKPLLVGVMPARDGAESLRTALADAAPSWVLAQRRSPVSIEATMLDAKTAPKTVAGSNADRAIAFEVLSYEQWGDKVPLAKARVRVRIADAAAVLFDRVVVTDTVVGDASMGRENLAARVAREVLSIVKPHARKAIP